MSVRGRIARVLKSLRQGRGREAIKELRRSAEESAITVLDDVVSAIAGHSVRTRPAPKDTYAAEEKDPGSPSGEPTEPTEPADVDAPLTAGPRAVPQTETAPSHKPESSLGTEPVEGLSPSPPAPSPPGADASARPPAEARAGVEGAALEAEGSEASEAPAGSEEPEVRVAIEEGSAAESADSGASEAPVGSEEPEVRAATEEGSAADAAGSEASEAPVVSEEAEVRAATEEVSAAESADSGASESPASRAAVAGSRAEEEEEEPAVELVLLVRDPDWLFAYWMPSPTSNDGILELVDDQEDRIEQPVDFAAGHAFVRAPVPGRTYRASLIAVGDPVRVFAISGVVRVPNPQVSVASEEPKTVAVGPTLRPVPEPPDTATLPLDRPVSPSPSDDDPSGPSGTPASSSPSPSSSPVEAAPSSWVLGMMPTSPGR